MADDIRVFFKVRNGAEQGVRLREDHVAGKNPPVGRVFAELRWRHTATHRVQPFCLGHDPGRILTAPGSPSLPALP